MSDRAEQFLAELLELCQRHQLTLSHEDSHGSFLVEPYSDANARWVRSAMDMTEDPPMPDARSVAGRLNAEDIVARLAALNPNHAELVDYDASELLCFFCGKDEAEDGHDDDCLWVAAHLHTPARHIIAARHETLNAIDRRVQGVETDADRLRVQLDVERHRLNALTDAADPAVDSAETFEVMDGTGRVVDTFTGERAPSSGVLVMPDELMYPYGPTTPSDVAARLRGSYSTLPAIIRESVWKALGPDERARLAAWQALSPDGRAHLTEQGPGRPPQPGVPTVDLLGPDPLTWRQRYRRWRQRRGASRSRLQAAPGCHLLPGPDVSTDVLPPSSAITDRNTQE